jgi:hypothetical protein
MAGRNLKMPYFERYSVLKVADALNSFLCHCGRRSIGVSSVSLPAEMMTFLLIATNEDNETR